MKINFSLLRDLVMVYPIPNKAQSETGIIVTNIVDKTAPREGIVLACGPGKLDDDGVLQPIDYKFGERVMYVLANLHTVKHEKDVFHVIPADEILCKLEN